VQAAHRVLAVPLASGLRYALVDASAERRQHQWGVAPSGRQACKAGELPGEMVRLAAGLLLGQSPAWAHLSVFAFALEPRVTRLRVEFEMVSLQQASRQAELLSVPQRMPGPRASAPQAVALPPPEPLASPQRETRRPVALSALRTERREPELRPAQQAFPRRAQRRVVLQEPAVAFVLPWLRHPWQLFPRLIALPPRHPRQPTGENAPAPSPRRSHQWNSSASFSQ
jgi:hypothetical protein